MEKLAPILGDWSLSGDQHPTMLGPAAKISGTESFAFIPGGQNFVMHNLDGRLDEHAMACVEIWERDGALGGFELQSFYGNGTRNTWKAAIIGNAWTLRGEWKGPKRSLHVRCTMTFDDLGTTRTSRWEHSDDAKTWLTFWDVTARKTA